MRSYFKSLQPNVGEPIDVVGMSYHIFKSDTALKIVFDEEERLWVTQGVSGKQDKKYSKVTLVSETAQDVIINLGLGEITDSRAGEITGTFAAINKPTNTIVPHPHITLEPGAAAQALGADPDRIEGRIGVKSSENTGIYIGDANIGALNPGGYIERGGADYVQTEAAIWIYNPSSTHSVTVNILELKRI